METPLVASVGRSCHLPVGGSQGQGLPGILECMAQPRTDNLHRMSSAVGFLCADGAVDLCGLGAPDPVIPYFSRLGTWVDLVALFWGWYCR